jgi:transcriptional regulator with AAA-type ATPase domain
MNLRALQCRLAESGRARLQMVSWSGPPRDLADGHAAGVYLVADETIAVLRRLVPKVNDRGRKHPARPLSALLLGQPGIPLVQAAFKSVNSLSNSIHTVLQHAVRRRERKPYIIGVPRAVFERIAARAGLEPDDVATVAAPDLDVLLSEPVDVPQELESVVVGESTEMHLVRQWIVRAAGHDHPIVILGESGTGKEVVARAVHNLNPSRKRYQFEPVNCGAIPEALFESQVFGYVPGAFTGALRMGSVGMWRNAAGGTIFLDEIGDLAPGHQVKLLRVLQERKILPVGGKQEIPVDARVIAATNRDLQSMAESGEFRDDLYYRLGSMTITLPPLRDRPEDVPILAAHFWTEMAPLRPPLSEDVLKELRQYRWRGNARELRYVLVNLHTTFQKTVPTVDHVRAVVRHTTRTTGAGGNGAEQTIRQVEYLRHLRRATGSIGACQRLVRSLDRRSLEPDRRTRLLAEAGGCLSELQLLGTRPERFQNLATFEATHRLAGALAAFQSLLARNDADAVRYGKKDLRDEAAAAGNVVRREEARVLRLL